MQTISFLLRQDQVFFIAINQKMKCLMLTYLMRIITQFGSITSSVVFSAILSVYNFHYGLFLISNILFSQLIVNLLKRIINRPRPFKTIHNTTVIDPPKCKYSFPSGHSSCALNISLVVSVFFPQLKVIFLSLALLTGLSRVYLGCHYPTDVICGFSLSYFVFLSTSLIL